MGGYMYQYNYRYIQSPSPFKPPPPPIHTHTQYEDSFWVFFLQTMVSLYSVHTALIDTFLKTTLNMPQLCLNC